MQLPDPLMPQTRSQTRSLMTTSEHHLDKFIGKYKNKFTHFIAGKPSQLAPGSTQSSNSPGNQLAATFHGLSLSNPTTPAVPQTSPTFIGGFHLGASASSPALGSSRPPVMPVPQVPSPAQQSLTMQYALDPDYSPRPENYMPSNTTIPPLAPQVSSYTCGSNSPPKPNVAAGLSPPASPTETNSSTVAPGTMSLSHSSALSPTPSPSRQAGRVGCAGITRVGERCSRKLKVDLTSSDTEDEGERIPRFCFQHIKEILKPSGYYARKTDDWVVFNDWIPSYLQQSTQASLRAEMEKIRSDHDEPGYIYTFEIRDTDTPNTIKLKVGRAVNVVKRIDQWGKQCGSKELVLRGFYPANVEEVKSSLMKGRVQAGSEKAAWCHRIERLVHIELADLVSTCVYLKPNWPDIEAPPSPATGSKGKTNGPRNGERKRCPDCGSMHKEIFEFQRWEKGKFKGKEWEQLVKPVIERWGRFVDLYV